MKSGEWTEGMALALATAVEAVAKVHYVDPLIALGALRRFPSRPESSEILGYDYVGVEIHSHKDTWTIVFRGDMVPNEPYSSSVKVSLLCEWHSPHGHRWAGRSATVKRSPLDEGTWVFEGKISKPLGYAVVDPFEERTEFVPS